MTDESDTRTVILDAAYTVLVEHGYDGFTTQAVADEAGRNQSLVHYYFETKRDLVHALLEKGLADLEEQVERFSTDDDPTDRLVTLAEFMIETSDDDSLASKRVLLELVAQAPYDDALREAIADDRERIQTYIADVVREGIDRGKFRDVDVEEFAVTYETAIGGAQMNAAVFENEANDERLVAGLQSVVEEYLLREKT